MIYCYYLCFNLRVFNVHYNTMSTALLVNWRKVQARSDDTVKTKRIEDYTVSDCFHTEILICKNSHKITQRHVTGIYCRLH